MVQWSTFANRGVMVSSNEKEPPVKKSAIWTAAGIAAVGFGVPAYAAISSPHEVKQIAPTPVEPVVSVDDNSTGTSLDDSEVTVVSAPNTLPTISLSVPTSDDSTSDSVEDATGTSVDDDATSNSVEDVSGNCDEAEHANDAACAGSGSPVGDNTHTSVDDSPHTSVDDNSGGGSNSGTGGSDGSGHGGSNG